MQWAARCGLEEADVPKQFDHVPPKQEHRGSQDISQIMHEPRCEKRRHAVLALRAQAYERAAAAAGREIGIQEKKASAQFLKLISLSSRDFETERCAVPMLWRPALGLRSTTFNAGALARLFELRLRNTGAKLPGPDAEQRWLRAVREGASQPPPTLSFSLDDQDFQLEETKHFDTAKMHRGEYPVLTAWSALVWEATLEALDARYGATSKLVLTHQMDSSSAAGQSQLTMRELCKMLHIVPKADTERQAWTSLLRALHEALHETIQEHVACPVCGPGGARYWNEAADKVIE